MEHLRRSVEITAILRTETRYRLSSLEYASSGSGIIRSDTKYPVFEAAALVPLRSRFFRSPRRRQEDLPTPTSGSVLVFQMNERFVVAPEFPAVLTSEAAVKATMVFVVMIRSQEVRAVAPLPTAAADVRVLLRASYSCTVLDPVSVLESGCWDASIDLRRYLLRDAKTHMLGMRGDVAENPEVSQRILARTLARNQIEPPMIPGMRVELMDVALRIHQDDDDEWRPPRQRLHVDEPYEGSSGVRDGYDTPGPDSDGRVRDGFGPD